MRNSWNSLFHENFLVEKLFSVKSRLRNPSKVSLRFAVLPVRSLHRDLPKSNEELLQQNARCLYSFWKDELICHLEMISEWLFINRPVMPTGQANQNGLHSGRATWGQLSCQEPPSVSPQIYRSVAVHKLLKSAPLQGAQVTSQFCQGLA